MSGLDVLSECKSVAASISAKADTNKARARTLSTALVASTAVIPLFLVLSELWTAGSAAALFVGKVIPAALAVVAAVIARIVQFEQPHQRWTLYRRWHRRFEMEALRYQTRIDPYTGDDRDAILAEKLVAGQLELDREWASLVPASSEIVDRPATS